MSVTQIVACYLQRLRIELETFLRTLKNLKNEGIEVNDTHVSFTNIRKTGHFVCDKCSLSEDCPAHLSLHKNAV